MSKIERIITEQALSWAQRESKARLKKETPGEWPVIVISREYGAGGRSLARELGKRMDFKVWDKDLLSAIADEAGADKRFLASLDERRRKMIDDFLTGFLMGSKHSNTHYLRSLIRVVRTIGEHGKSIIVGRGSNYIIKYPTILRVRLIGPIEKRAAFVADNEGISEKEAKKMIKARDAERDDFIRFHFNQDSGIAHDYDLVLNSGTFNIKQLADLVILAYEKKIGKAIPVMA